jgi:hypothetical protein
MKKNLLFLILIGLLSFFNAEGQAKPIVTLSDKIKTKGGEYLSNHILSTADGHYIRAYKSGFSSVKLCLHKYDNEFNLVFNNEFKPENKNEDALNFYNMKTKIGLLSMLKDKKSDLLTYKFTPVNLDGKVEKFITLGKFKFEKSKDEPTYNFTQSQDSSKSLFSFYVDNNDDELKLQVFLSVIDNDFKEVWNKKVSLKRPQEVIEILSAVVNNDGNAYLLIKEFEGDKAKESKKTKKDERPAYKLKLIKVSGKAEETDKEFVLDIKNDFVVSAAMKVLQNGEIAVLGMFSTTKKKYTNGVFSLKINAADSIYNISKKEFSEEVLAALNEEDETSSHKDQEGLKEEFKFLDLSYKKDGSAMVILEENYEYTVSNYRGRAGSFGGSYSYTTYYVTKDVITLRLSPGGVVEKIHVIPKRQRFADINSYNSSLIMSTEEGTYIIFNDDKDNLAKPMGSKVKYISSMGDCVATSIFIDRNDKVTRTPLFSKEDTKAVFMPALSKRIGDKKVFFVAQKYGSLFSSSDLRLGTIVF